jgi:hypothetical protein
MCSEVDLKMKPTAAGGRFHYLLLRVITWIEANKSDQIKTQIPHNDK